MDYQEIEFLDAKIDENYEPNEEGLNKIYRFLILYSFFLELHDYARFLGIDPFEDKDFLYIAQDGLKATLPDPWRACRLRGDELYYHNSVTGVYKADHPLDDYYRSLFQQEKNNARKKKKQNNSAPSNFKSKFVQKLNMGSVIPPVTIVNTANKTLPSIGHKSDVIPSITKSNELKNKSMSFDASFSVNNSFMSNNIGGKTQISSGIDDIFQKSIDENPNFMFKKNKIISEAQLDESFDQELFGNVVYKGHKANIDNDYEQIDNEIEIKNDENFSIFEKLKEKEIADFKMNLNNELKTREKDLNNDLNNDLELFKNDLSSNVQASWSGFVREKEGIRKSLMEEYDVRYQQDMEKLEEEHDLTMKDVEAKENINNDYEMQDYESDVKNGFESKKLVNNFIFFPSKTIKRI